MDFFEKYKSDLDLSKRTKTMQRALELLLEKKKSPGIIIETGTQRLMYDPGGGMSTTIFADFCKTYNFHLFTCDNNPDALYVAARATERFASFVSYVENDSVEFLKQFNQKIDLLYLDSMDCPEYDSPTSTKLLASQNHQLAEIKAAWNKLSDDPIILLDDNNFDNGGKTRLTKYFLKEYGFDEIMGGNQSLWIKL